MRLLLPANDEAMVFLNPLTLDNVTYRRVDEIRKNMDHFLHIQNGAILLNPLSVRTSYNHERGGPCRCQNRRISGRGSRTVRLKRMVTGGGGHVVYPGSGPLDGGNTLLPA